jgi:hypothetical protein
MRTQDPGKILVGTRFDPVEWIGRLIVVFALTALLFLSAFWACWIDAYLRFVPSLLGLSLVVILLARQSYYSLVSLGYVILLQEFLGFYFLSLSSCCGPGGGVSDGLVILLGAPPVLMIGYGMWKALPGRNACKMGKPALVLTLIGFLTAAPGLLWLGTFAAMYWLARRWSLRAALAQPA